MVPAQRRNLAARGVAAELGAVRFRLRRVHCVHGDCSRTQWGITLTGSEHNSRNLLSDGKLTLLTDLFLGSFRDWAGGSSLSSDTLHALYVYCRWPEAMLHIKLTTLGIFSTVLTFQGMTYRSPHPRQGLQGHRWTMGCCRTRIECVLTRRSRSLLELHSRLLLLLACTTLS